MESLSMFTFPFPSELLYWAQVMKKGKRELPHQSANCGRIYEEEFLIPIYNLVHQAITHNNTIIDTTTTTDGTTSAPSTLSHLLVSEK